MPKVTPSSLPISGLFAVAKPSGPTSMKLINDMKPLINNSALFVEKSKLGKVDAKQKKKGRFGRQAVKIGQGGTLDPLADGVLVMGVGKGTKELSGFLDCVKEYRTTCLLGCETDSYDSEGARVRSAPWRHITKERIEDALAQFRGDIEQTPPIFSALKMDGKPLHEYAREGIPLPRPIEKRKVTVHALELVEWLGRDHSWRQPAKALTDEQKIALQKSLRGIDAAATVADDPGASESESDEVPPAFVLRMTVSGGTYVRSIVHELAHAVGSAGHVVTLTRSKQGRFALEPSGEELGCVSWDVFEKAIDEGIAAEPGEDGLKDWEREVMNHLQVVDS
ncbi:pseudouridylate synthase 4 [Punctularia strigosozonata HHB-11173 SS5]|uniref:pseudouridylate synthase 4 n=1 Tax=Punctularia strigosozonata (strain HHB-11173) TaxID=741275 RepID=UPI000441776D|nr:pseudouridylate synthase 4 [Punctularia strigosozonata HHB-11173 SS5]EIN07290.1 pseudouridylate synthase 4 [Punctularia strigosozonata HHB-11173 SS5]